MTVFTNAKGLRDDLAQPFCLARQFLESSRAGAARATWAVATVR